MQEFYYELTLKVESEHEVILNFLTEVYEDAIEELNGSFILRSESQLDEIQSSVLEFVKNLSLSLNKTINIQTDIKKLKNIDWIKTYQDSISPIEVGKFYVHPSWYEAKDNLINIIIDPSLAFGSGHHETTNGCLELISKYVKSNNEVLDVGCGSGILSIASSKLGAKVDICDTDELAIESSINNFKSNNSQIENSWVGSVTQSKHKYDLVLANIVADVLIFISKDLKNSVKENGLLIVSGILDIYKDRVLEKFKDFEIVESLNRGEWFTLCLKKVSKVNNEK